MGCKVSAPDLHLHGDAGHRVRDRAGRDDAKPGRHVAPTLSVEELDAFHAEGWAPETTSSTMIEVSGGRLASG